MISSVSDIDVARTVHRYSLGIVQRGTSSSAAVAYRACSACAWCDTTSENIINIQMKLEGSKSVQQVVKSTQQSFISILELVECR